MSVAIFGMYLDEGKTHKVVTGHNMQTSIRRKDWEKKGNIRGSLGSLYTWKKASRKYEARLTLRNVLKTDLDSIKTVFDATTTVCFFPDEENEEDTYYQVKITNDWDPVKDKFTGRYSLSLELKQI